MNKFFKILIGISVAGSFTQASVLGLGEKSVRLDYASHVATKLYAGADSVPGLPSDFKLTTNALEAGFGFGVGDSQQIDLTLQYSSSEAKPAGVAGANDERKAISQAGFKWTLGLLAPANDNPWNLDIYFGVRAPGDTSQIAASLIALNDGVTKFDLGLVAGYLQDWGSVNTDVRYTSRAGNPGDILNITITVPINVGSYYVGPVITKFSALSGLEPADAGYVLLDPSRKEEFTSAGLLAGYTFDGGGSLDVYFTSKSQIKNSDDGVSYGIGYAFNY